MPRKTNKIKGGGKGKRTTHRRMSQNQNYRRRQQKHPTKKTNIVQIILQRQRQTSKSKHSKSKSKKKKRETPEPVLSTRETSEPVLSTSPLKTPQPSKDLLQLDKDFIKDILIPKQTKHKSSKTTLAEIICSIYLIKIKTGDTTFEYYIYDSLKNEFWAGAKYDSELPKLEGELKENSIKRCKGIEKEWIDLEYESNNISIFVFSINKEDMSKKNVTKRKYPYSLCGLLLLNNLKQNSLYLTLICSLQKLGGYLLGLTEQIAKYFGKNRIFLSSLEDPMPVYIHKKYKFIKGKDIFNFEHLNTDPDKPFIRSNPNNVAQKITYYEDQWGDIFNLKDINRIYTTLSAHKKKKGNILMNIKGNLDDGFEMYKDLV